MLERLEPADRAVPAQVGRPWLAAVVGCGLARAGKTAGVPLQNMAFVGSIGRLAWVKDNGCSWGANTCARVAKHGNLEVLQWARECGIEWNEMPCQGAASGGHLEVLQWAREHDCPWTKWTCSAPL